MVFLVLISAVLVKGNERRNSSLQSWGERGHLEARFGGWSWRMKEFRVTVLDNPGHPEEKSVSTCVVSQGEIDSNWSMHRW